MFGRSGKKCISFSLQLRGGQAGEASLPPLD